MLRIDNESQYLELISRLKNINDYCYGLSCIDQIAINKPQVKEIESEGVNIKLKLANYNDIALNKNAETFFCDYFKRNGIDFKKCNYNSELIIYKLLSVNTTQLDNLIFMFYSFHSEKPP